MAAANKIQLQVANWALKFLVSTNIYRWIKRERMKKKLTKNGKHSLVFLPLIYPLQTYFLIFSVDTKASTLTAFNIFFFLFCFLTNNNLSSLYHTLSTKAYFSLASKSRMQENDEGKIFQNMTTSLKIHTFYILCKWML